MNPLGPFQLYRINSETEKEMNNLFFFLIVLINNIVQ